MIRDGINSMSKQDPPHEALWPYVIAKFRTKPSARATRTRGRTPRCSPSGSPR
jgi:hypothetical protein